MILIKNYKLPLTKMVTLVSVYFGQMYAEDNKHLALYLTSFHLRKNAHLFLFPALNLAAPVYDSVMAKVLFFLKFLSLYLSF